MSVSHVARCHSPAKLHNTDCIQNWNKKCFRPKFVGCRVTEFPPNGWLFTLGSFYLRLWTGLPDFSWPKHTDTGKVYRRTTNYTKRSYIHYNRMAINYRYYVSGHTIYMHTNIFRSKALQNIPKLGFLVLEWTIWQTWLWINFVKNMYGPRLRSISKFPIILGEKLQFFSR
jgi:hypothetical protein